MSIKITYSPKFINILKKAQPDVKRAALVALEKLTKMDSVDAATRSGLRLHPVNDVWKIDVLKKTWQISLRKVGNDFIALKLETHKTMDRLY